MDYIPLNEHGQPINPEFNYYSNRLKALSGLRGILHGIAADMVINDDERLFLETWMSDNEPLFMNKLLDEVNKKIRWICSSPTVSIDDIIQLASDIDYLVEYDDRLLAKDGYDYLTEILIGICKGIDADRQLNNEEIGLLEAFISQNPYLQVSWPASELHKLIQAIIADGVITTDERDALQNFIRSLFGDALVQGVADGLSTTLPLDYGAIIEFPDRLFCLTGKFLHGARKECENLIVDRGGQVVDRINRHLHYLVVGTLSSQDWKFSNYGRKIEQAVEYRDEKQYGIRIVSEEMWLSAL